MMSPSPSRARLWMDYLRYAGAAASAVPRTLWSVAHGRMEPEILDGADFGQMRHVSHTIAQVGSLEELQRALARAYAAGRPVTCAGSRHSANGQTLPPDGGLQLRLDRDSGRWTAPEMVDESLVKVSAAHTWRTLQKFLRERGRTFPVLTDHLTTTIGGTLSVGGGIGTASVAFGRQLDHLRGFNLVLPDGEARWCDPTQNPGLFRHVPGGMGELGVMDEVLLATRPHRPFLAVLRFQARSLHEAMAHVRGVLEDPDKPENLAHMVVEGPILNTPFVQFEFGLEFDQKDEARRALAHPPEALARLAPLRRARAARLVVDADQSNDRHNRSASYVSSLVGFKHLWNDFFFADVDKYLTFLRFAHDEIFARRGHRFLMSGLAFAYPGDPLDPVDPGHRRAAFSYPCREAGPWRWSVGFNFSVPPGPDVEPTAASLDLLRREATRLGAGVYGYGYDQRTREDFEVAYGPIVDDFRRLKQEVDPRGLFGGGLPIFDTPR